MSYINKIKYQGTPYDIYAVNSTNDGDGNNIAATYATQANLNTVSGNVSNIVNGTTVVDKANKDGNGNNIAATYMTKGVTEVTLTTSWTSSGDFYTQSVSVSGMTSSDTPFLSLKTLQYTSLEDIENAETEFAKIVDFDTRSGSILIRAKEETTQNLVLIVKGK